ncbi:BQ2448_2297 [Microbotryum intermedium]|uniref:BQ2448_2297 protein n=1 Tax=Microbotryum intermedium TaxID=269621 RepID=A0A238F803_9BASI|nr:BQ2448_2297 [Microbotryum intermedium]
MGPKTKTKPKPVPQSLTSGPVDQGRRSAQLTNTRAAPSRLKVVVRRLPPALPEPVFWSSVASWVALPPDLTAAPPVSTSAVNTGVDSVVWAQYRPGKVRARHDKDDTHSRAYLSFKSPEALIAFHHAYDGWNFKARTGEPQTNPLFGGDLQLRSRLTRSMLAPLPGQVTRAVVEFAPYQNTRSVSNKRDPRQGTIEQDPDFIAFQDALANPKVPQVELPAKITPTSTPLLDHLRARKAAARSASRGKIPALAQGPPPPKPSKRSKKETSKETTPVAVAAIAPAKSPLKKSSRRKVAQKSVTNERGGSAFDSESKSELKSARGVKQESKTKPSEAENQVVATKSRVIAATEAAKPKQAREAPTPTQIAEATELVRRTLQTKHQAKYQGGALAKPAPPQKKAARPPKDQSIRTQLWVVFPRC